MHSVLDRIQHVVGGRVPHIIVSSSTLMMVQSLLYFELRGAPTRDQKRLYGFSLHLRLDARENFSKIEQTRTSNEI